MSMGRGSNEKGLSPVYLIAERAGCHPRPLTDVISRALDAGIRLVQLREKNAGRDELRLLADQLLRIIKSTGALLLINSEAELAVEIGAQGVHLPASGPDPGSIRKRFGARFLIGCSTHNITEVERATREGADFVTYSPVYPSLSKPGHGLAVGLDGLRAAARATHLPVYALGGITPERTADCLRAGAYGVAVMSGILAADDIENAVKAYLGVTSSNIN